MTSMDEDIPKNEATNFVAGIVAGSVIAGFFSPWDRALYISVRDRIPFFDKTCWRNPYQGFLNGMLQRTLSSGLYFLATVGSVAPFVGLFGTVWGIKNAFQEIAIQESSNLAVVAPGIAEALLATALGLLAAIPAVVFYNKLSGDSQKIINGVEEFSEEFSVIISRHIDMNKNHKE